MTEAAAPTSVPRRELVPLGALMFGMIAAPGIWLVQLMVSFGVSASACYGGDHPTTIASGTALRAALYAFDAVALTTALAGAIVSYTSWRTVASEGLKTHDARTRFMALWGVMSSLCFLGAILFNTIGSAMVPLCVR